MARSTYIYLILDGLRNDRVVGAFTVKHEMEAYMKRYKEAGFYAVRFRDGDPAYPRQIP